MGKLEYAFGLFLNVDGQRIIGKDEAEILEALEKYGSIAAAAKKLEKSYGFTWNYLIRMTRSLMAFWLGQIRRDSAFD